MASTAADIQIGVNLIDDYLSLAEAPVADTLLGRFVVAQDLAKQETASELLTVGPSGELAHFYPDTNSNSGWGLDTHTVTPPTNASGAAIKRLAGFYASGILQSLCYFDTDETGVDAVAWIFSAAPGSWKTATLTNSVLDALTFTYQSDTYTDPNGTSYVYGITKGFGEPSFFLTMFNDSEQAWAVAYNEYLTEFGSQFTTAASFGIAPGATRDELTVFWAQPGTTTIHYRAGTISDGYLNWTTSAQAIDTSACGAIAIDRIYPFTGDFGEDNLLLLDTSGTLYIVSGFNTQSTSITALTNPNAAQGISDPINQPQPVGALTANAGQDNSGNQRVIAIESGTNNLWYFTISAGGQYDPATDWANLGGPYETIGCPASMIYGPELFAVDLNNSVYHKALTPQDPNGQSNPVWVTRKIAQPVSSTSTPQNVATYSMQVQVNDADGNPVAKQVVEVTADHAVTVVINDIAHSIGPNQFASLSCDSSGQATVIYPTSDLKPPVMTFTASGTTVSRWCQGDVVQVKSTDTDPVSPPLQSVSNRLQNKDTTRPLSNEGLTTAHPQAGTCPATGVDKTTPQLMSQSYASTDPDGSACASLINAGSWMDPNKSHADGTIDASKLPVPHWRIDFSHPDGPKFEILSAEQARILFARAELAHRTLDGPILKGSGGVFGDVCEFFKHMFKQLNTFAATVEKNAETGLDELKIAFNDTLTFIISTVKEAGAATETIFSKIAAGIEAVANDVYKAIERVIEWLKMLFNWQDILNTHTAIKYAVNQTLFVNLKDAVSGAETDLAKWFSSLKSEVSTIFNNLDSHFDSSTTFNDMANSAQTAAPAPGVSDGNVLAATTSKNTQQQHASKCNYANSRSQSSFGNIGAMALAATPKNLADGDPTQAIVQAIQTNIMDPENAEGQSLFTQFSNELLAFITDTLTDPSEFFDFVILAFLQAAEALTLFIIDVLEAVLEAILNLLDDAVSALQGMVNASIDIPIITWIWKNIITDGDEFTILDLFCLIMAVPATILYKIIFGGSSGSPPFNDTTLQELTTSGLAWPVLPSVRDSGVEWSEPVGYTPPPHAVTESLGIIAGLTYFWTGFGEADTDYYAYMGEADKAAALSIFILILEAYQDGATAPYQVFAKEKADRTEADTWALNFWYAGLAQLSSDFCFVALSSTHTLTKFVDTAGPVCDTAIGICWEAFGVVACTHQSSAGSGYTDWDCANDIIQPLDDCLKFMLLCGATADEILQACDIILGLGAMVTVCGAAKNG